MLSKRPATNASALKRPSAGKVGSMNDTVSKLKHGWTEEGGESRKAKKSKTKTRKMVTMREAKKTQRTMMVTKSCGTKARASNFNK